MAEEIKTTKTIELSNRVFNLVMILTIAVVVSFFGTLMYQLKLLPQNMPHDISVTGEGKAYVKPDVAIIQLGVHTEGAESQTVVNQNNEVMNRAIASIKGSGIEDKDIRTTFYSLTPQYDFTETGRNFRGYALDQQVQVKIRNFEKISEVLDKATTSGVNAISDLQFTIDDMEKVRAAARAEAIAQARAKARTLFRQTGLRAIKLVNVSEGTSGCAGFCPPIPFGFGGAEKDAVASIAPNIQPGQSEIVSTVTLTYRVR